MERYRTEIRINRPAFIRDLEVVMFQRDAKSDKMWIGELSLKQIEDGHPIRPTTTIDEKGAQVLMDELWACGIRPTEGAGTAGSMEATRRHLEDMRLIALGTLRGIGAIGKEEK